MFHTDPILTAFTPGASLIGGTLIGLAAVALMLTHGRIFGATGLVSGLIFAGDTNDRLWRLWLIAGMVSGPAAMLLLTQDWPAVQVPVSRLGLIVGGLIVGVGVSLGSGCTSGHGVCGMARLSRRSIAATATFMLTTALTVWVLRHGLEVLS